MSVSLSGCRYTGVTYRAFFRHARDDRKEGPGLIKGSRPEPRVTTYVVRTITVSRMAVAATPIMVVQTTFRTVPG